MYAGAGCVGESLCLPLNFTVNSKNKPSLKKTLANKQSLNNELFKYNANERSPLFLRCSVVSTEALTTSAQQGAQAVHIYFTWYTIILQIEFHALFKKQQLIHEIMGCQLPRCIC